MNKLMVIAVLCLVQTGFSEDLSTLDGTVYRNVTIISANPERMMIAYDGGGIQIEYSDLAPDALSTQQWQVVEEGLATYAKRKARMEQLQQEAEALRLERERFAQAQRDKGLVFFEGDWIKPADRQEVLANRELDKLEQERLTVELEKQKAELRKAQLLVEQEQQRLNEQRNFARTSYSYYGYPSRRTGVVCVQPKSYEHSSRRHSSGTYGSFSTAGTSISLHSRSSHFGYDSGLSPNWPVDCRTR